MSTYDTVLPHVWCQLTFVHEARMAWRVARMAWRVFPHGAYGVAGSAYGVAGMN